MAAIGIADFTELERIETAMQKLPEEQIEAEECESVPSEDFTEQVDLGWTDYAAAFEGQWKEVKLALRS